MFPAAERIYQCAEYKRTLGLPIAHDTHPENGKEAEFREEQEHRCRQRGRGPAEHGDTDLEEGGPRPLDSRGGTTCVVSVHQVGLRRQSEYTERQNEAQNTFVGTAKTRNTFP